ncbi:hypothetical protein [Nonomuraea sp. NPDC050202]|uniref:hypothetical protein n=1 Tax=Nonomuraea sp. NPDC050202 TaxID=3155035 RepID=UPI0033FC637E
MVDTPHRWATTIFVPVTGEQARAIVPGQKFTITEPTRAHAPLDQVYCIAHGGSPGNNPCPFPPA